MDLGGFSIRLVAAIVCAGSLGCGGRNDVVNGFATYGSARIQGFVSRPDGSPVPDVAVFASFGPGAFGHSVDTDSRGLYEWAGDTHTPLEEPPFSDGVIHCRLTVGEGLADTVVTVRFAPTGQEPTLVTVNFVIPSPDPVAVGTSFDSAVHRTAQ